MATTSIAAPAVRSLEDTISTLNQGIAPQQANLQAQIDANAQAGQAQVAGLDAKKTQAFTRDIPAQAQKQGVFFSGFTPEEQAQYTANTYLPALAQLEQQIAGNRLALQSKQADLQSGVFNKAVDLQNQDQQNLYQWQTAEAQREFQAGQNQINNDFTARQNEIDHLFQAGENQKAQQAQAQLQADKIAADKQMQAQQIAASQSKSSLSAGPSYSDLADVAKGAFNSASPDKYLDQNEASQVYAGLLQTTGGDANLARQLFNQGMAASGKVKYGNYSI